MFAWFKKSAHKQRIPPPTRVEWDAEVVRLYTDEIETERFRWADLTGVYAFKQDCFGFDRIWVRFEARAPGKPSLVHEEVGGFGLLIAEMERRCTGYRADWWSAVAHPAFAENDTVIWRAPPKTAAPSTRQS